MSNYSIKKTIEEYFSELFKLKDNAWISATDLMEQGYLDSLSLVKLMVFLEDEFSICIDEYMSFEHFKTIDSIVNVVETEVEKQKGQN